jgi:hypothetical protein
MREGGEARRGTDILSRNPQFVNEKSQDKKRDMEEGMHVDRLNGKW